LYESLSKKIVQKPHERATTLLRQLKFRDMKRVFFTDEKKVLSKPSCQQLEQQSGREARKLMSSG